MIDQNTDDALVVSEKSKIDTIVHSFFDVFTNTKGHNPDWEIIDQVCIPQTIIIKKTGLAQEVYNLASFTQPRKLLLSNGNLLEFEEKEIKEETYISGNIAQRSSHYKKSGILNGIKFEQFGNKLFQFIKTEEGWKINSVAWEDL